MSPTGSAPSSAATTTGATAPDATALPRPQLSKSRRPVTVRHSVAPIPAKRGVTDGKEPRTPQSALPVGCCPGRRPLLGHVLPLWRRPLEFLESLSVLGDLVKIHIGSCPAYMVCHPELVQRVLVNAQAFDKGGPYYDTARTLAGNGISTCGWEDHRRQRPLVMPVFQKQRITAYTRTMAQEIADVTAAWPSGRAFDITAAAHSLLSISPPRPFSPAISARPPSTPLTSVCQWSSRVFTPGCSHPSSPSTRSPRPEIVTSTAH
ncbi:cytochrome P450 [Streptomyces stramineus]